jgi:hypothetical protein
MNCPYNKEEFTLLLTNSLDERKRIELENHLAACPDCQMEFEGIRKVWKLMGEIPSPIPSDNIRSNFSAILNTYKEEMQERRKPSMSLPDNIMRLWRMQPRLQFVYALVLLLFGLGMGFLLNRPAQTETAYNQQINSLSSQVSEMKQMMMLSLLENPSASQRIRAVGYTSEISKVNNKVIEALLTTLNEDPNINVRLITLDALVKLSKEPTVREGLVKSITQQESPLMQSAIADVMVKLQERRSIKSLQKLLNKKDLNEMVKIKIEQSIRKLI